MTKHIDPGARLREKDRDKDIDREFAAEVARERAIKYDRDMMDARKRLRQQTED